MTESQEIRIKALELAIELKRDAPVNKIVEWAQEIEDFIVGDDSSTCKGRRFYPCYNK